MHAIKVVDRLRQCPHDNICINGFNAQNDISNNQLATIFPLAPPNDPHVYVVLMILNRSHCPDVPSAFDDLFCLRKGQDSRERLRRRPTIRSFERVLFNVCKIKEEGKVASAD